MRVEYFSATFSWCRFTMQAMFRRRLMSCSRSMMVLALEGSREAMGSSHSSSLGCCMTARAIPTRCFCPPERSPAR